MTGFLPAMGESSSMAGSPMSGCSTRSGLRLRSVAPLTQARWASYLNRPIHHRTTRDLHPRSTAGRELMSQTCSIILAMTLGYPNTASHLLQSSRPDAPVRLTIQHYAPLTEISGSFRRSGRLTHDCRLGR